MPRRPQSSATLSARPASLAIPPAGQTLFDRVATIVDRARVAVAGSVNQEMVLAYWHIGREIVEAMQRGEPRADYGARLIEDLSGRLTARYGKGFSAPNLRNFRQFYLAYPAAAPGNALLEGRQRGADSIRYPRLTVEDIRAAVLYAAHVLAHEDILPIAGPAVPPRQ